MSPSVAPQVFPLKVDHAQEDRSDQVWFSVTGTPVNVTLGSPLLQTILFKPGKATPSQISQWPYPKDQLNNNNMLL